MKLYTVAVYNLGCAGRRIILVQIISREIISSRGHGVCPFCDFAHSSCFNW